MNASAVGKQWLLIYSLNLVNIKNGCVGVYADPPLRCRVQHLRDLLCELRVFVRCHHSIAAARYAAACAPGHGRPAWTVLPLKFARVWYVMALGILLVIYFPQRWATTPSLRCHWLGGPFWGHLCPCSWCRCLFGGCRSTSACPGTGFLCR